MYSSLRSIPIARLPNLSAADAVLPVPLKGSRTIPCIGQVESIGILIVLPERRRSGCLFSMCPRAQCPKCQMEDDRLHRFS